MLNSHEIFDALVNHPVYVGIAAVVVCYGILYFLRKRRARRRKSEIDIPDFLSGRSDGGHPASSDVEVDWTEIHPLPTKVK